MDENARDKYIIETHAAVAEIRATLKGVCATTEKHTEEIDELKSKPGKRWDTVVVSFIGTLIGVVVGMFIKK